MTSTKDLRGSRDAPAAASGSLAAERKPSVASSMSATAHPELLKPWAKPAGNPAAHVQRAATSESRQSPVRRERPHNSAALTASLPALKLETNFRRLAEQDDIIANPLLTLGASATTPRGPSTQACLGKGLASPVADDLDRLSDASINRLRRMASDTQETVERAGSGFGAALASGQVTPSTQRGILSTVDAPESFSNPLLTTDASSRLPALSTGSEAALTTEILRTPGGSRSNEENMAAVVAALTDMLNRGGAFAGKYTLKQEPIKGQGIISIQAVERFPPGRAVIVRLFMTAAGYDRERQLLARLPSGEQVPELLDAFDKGAVPGAPHLPPCLVTDAGDYTLAEWPAKRARAPDDVQKRAVLAMVVKTLAGLHGSGIVHSALSAGAVVWHSRDNAMKVADLCCAAAPGDLAPLSPTLRYSPPEAIAAAGKRKIAMTAGFPVDMWSLGMLAYEIFEGRSMFEGVSATDFASMMAGKQALPWEGPDGGILGSMDNADARTFILSLLKREPAERWTMRQVLGCALFRHPVHGTRSAQSTAQRAASPTGGPPQSEASRALNTAPSPRAGYREFKDGFSSL